MHEKLVSDELWEIIAPLLPPDPPREKGGRPRIPTRNAFAGIVHVLKSGVPWRMLPKEIGAAAAQLAGVVCATGRRPLCGGDYTTSCWTISAGPTRSTGRGPVSTLPASLLKGGRKDRSQPSGPRSHRLEAAPRHRREWCTADGSTHRRQLARLEGSRRVDRLDQAGQGQESRPRKKPVKLPADKGYDYPRCRRFLRRRGMSPRIARRSVENREIGALPVGH
jgi:hypothetical protein